MALVPLKVKITLTASGQAKYPAFNTLPVIQASGLDWSKYIDVNGSGWLYDSAGHRDSDPDSPIGQQWGMILVPVQFATEAELAFPEEVEAIPEEDAIEFYEIRYAHKMPVEEIDVDVLTKIKLKQDLAIPLTTEDLEAIDPTNPRRGVRINKLKTFAGLKEMRGIEVVQNIRRRGQKKTWRKPAQ